MVLGLATSNKIWLALFAGVFIVFALLSSFVFPRRRPDFPGEQGREVVHHRDARAVRGDALRRQRLRQGGRGTSRPRKPPRRRLRRSRASPSRPRRRRRPRKRPERPRAILRPGSRSSPHRAAAAVMRSRLRARTPLSGRTSTRPCRARTRRSSARVDRRSERGGRPGLCGGGHAGRLRPEALRRAARGSGRFSLDDLGSGEGGIRTRDPRFRRYAISSRAP